MVPYVPIWLNGRICFCKNALAIAENISMHIFSIVKEIKSKGVCVHHRFFIGDGTHQVIFLLDFTVNFDFKIVTSFSVCHNCNHWEILR
jgi:hypothetical protein